MVNNQPRLVIFRWPSPSATRQLPQPKNSTISTSKKPQKVRDARGFATAATGSIERRQRGSLKDMAEAQWDPAAVIARAKELIHTSNVRPSPFSSRGGNRRRALSCT